jgi:chromosome segregation ATPase
VLQKRDYDLELERTQTRDRQGQVATLEHELDQQVAALKESEEAEREHAQRLEERVEALEEELSRKRAELDDMRGREMSEKAQTQQLLMTSEGMQDELDSLNALLQGMSRELAEVRRDKEQVEVGHVRLKVEHEALESRQKSHSIQVAPWRALWLCNGKM